MICCHAFFYCLGCFFGGQGALQASHCRPECPRKRLKRHRQQVVLMTILQWSMTSCISPASHICRHRVTSAFLSDPLELLPAIFGTDIDGGLVTIERSFKALCPSSGASRHDASRDGQCCGSVKISKHQSVTSSCHNVSNPVARGWAVIQGIAWRSWLRGFWLSVVRCSTRGVFLVTELSTILEKVANYQISYLVTCLTVVATISSARSDSTADHTRCSIQLSQLSNAFRRGSLASLFLTHMRHATVVRVSTYACESVPHWAHRKFVTDVVAAAPLFFRNWATMLELFLLGLAALQGFL